ncbi:MAG: hypothetical protein DI547_12250 [Sphingobium sp.]|jgi:hypothetical protein|nr:MAG: hypothetical protein DI547_12250 [Sphingobium sp.]
MNKEANGGSLRENRAGSPDDRPLAEQRTRPLIPVLIAIALILAIGFFYLTGRSEGHDRSGDKILGAAASAESAATAIGDAARDAANRMKEESGH